MDGGVWLDLLDIKYGYFTIYEVGEAWVYRFRRLSVSLEKKQPLE